MNRRYGIAFVGLSVLLFAAPLFVLLRLADAEPLAEQAAGRASEIVAHPLDSLVNSFLTNGQGVSVAVAVVRGRDTIAMFARGQADLRARRAATENTIYRVGSITKQFTAAMILRLVEQQKLQLDDTIGQHLPSVPGEWRSITVRRLLNHTGGLHNYTDVPAWRAIWRDDVTPEQLIELVADLPLDFTPGTRWAYSNTGYVVLGMIIEKSTGQSYAEAVDAQIFQPLGMSRSLYCPSSPTPESGIAAGYVGRSRAPFRSMTHPYSAGALCSTVGDFLRWQYALPSGRILGHESHRQMTTPEPLLDGQPQNYGFGLLISDLEGHRSISHGGAVNGFLSFAAHFPDDSLHVVIFSNSATSAFNGLVQSIQRTALGLPLTLATVPLPIAERDRFIGTYDLQRPGGRALALRVFARNGALFGQAEGQQAIALRYLGNNVFGTDSNHTLRLTFVDQGGEVSGVTLLQGGSTVSGPRRP